MHVVLVDIRPYKCVTMRITELCTIESRHFLVLSLTRTLGAHLISTRLGLSAARAQTSIGTNTRYQYLPKKTRYLVLLWYLARYNRMHARD